MATVTQPKPAPPPKVQANPLSSGEKCAVEEREGGAVVHFRIDPQDWARLKRRMGPQDPARYMWENHLYRMIMGAVY